MEAKAEVVALILAGEPESWAKSQAEDASKALQKLLADGLDASVFAQAVGEVCGNHSAMRQLLEKHGLLRGSTAAKPAWIAECEKRLEAITKAQDAKANKEAGIK